MANILLANFGGPRNLDEIPPFLTELLCDKDVIRTRFPQFFHNFLFKRIAKKRARSICKDYEEIGGFSPIYFDTEKLALELFKKLNRPVHTFHRYLPATHAMSFRQIEKSDSLIVLPLFPQFSYSTTGSIARLLGARFSKKLFWIKSYAAHPAFISSYQRRIRDFLKQQRLSEEDCVLLFSAHGLPQQSIDEGDPYEWECNQSFEELRKAFPKAVSKLCYQSKFGKGEWLKPYTNEACGNVLEWNKGRKNAVFIPISFTSDHIETLFEIEKLYLPIIESKGLRALRCPALNLESYWIDALIQILKENSFSTSQMLIRGAKNLFNI